MRSDPIRCSSCDRILPYFSQGPDMEAWLYWQQPHWTEVLMAWPKGRHQALILDSIQALATLVFLTGVVIALLAGLG